MPKDKVEVCPHCRAYTQFATHQVPLSGTEYQGRPTITPDVIVLVHVCRNCHGILVDLFRPGKAAPGTPRPATTQERVHPSRPSPPKLSSDVPKDLAEAYGEAWSLQTISEHAAAVMARRCLQLTLRKKGFVKKTLHAEIEAAEQAVGSDLAQQLHYVREVGNIGAHPLDAEGGLDFEKLIDVQPGELVALFAAIREAFDEFYIRPARKQRDLDALNEKLKAAGKKPIT